MTLYTIEELNKDASERKSEIAMTTAKRILEAYTQQRTYVSIHRRVGPFVYHPQDKEKSVEILTEAAALIRQKIPNATIKPLGCRWLMGDYYEACTVQLD